MRDFSNSCEVLFLDYGNLETVEYKNIRRMVRDFVNTPTLMSFCSIDGKIFYTEVISEVNQVISLFFYVYFQEFRQNQLRVW